MPNVAHIIYVYYNFFEVHKFLCMLNLIEFLQIFNRLVCRGCGRCCSLPGDENYIDVEVEKWNDVTNLFEVVFKVEN